MPNLGTTEILIIAAVVVLLFGATKLPQMARSLGQSARVFKAETRGMQSDESQADQRKASGPPSPQTPSPQQLASGESSFSETNGQGFRRGSQQPQNSQQNDPEN